MKHENDRISIFNAGGQKSFLSKGSLRPKKPNFSFLRSAKISQYCQHSDAGKQNRINNGP